MNNSYKDAIKSRRSVRTFKEQPISIGDMKRINEIIENLETPFDIPVEVKVFDAKDNNLNSPVITGENTYIITKVKPQKNWGVEYGYLIEKLILLLEDLGIGTTLIGGTFNRKVFENAIEKLDNEIMPLATPIGYPDNDMTPREKQMRKAIKADERLPFEILFFDKDFSKPLDKKDAGQFAEALDLMRLAPSAVNNQPWRAIVDNNTVHFYKNIEKRLSESAPWDVQKIDMGIGLANFDLSLKENGINGNFFIEEPDIKKNVEFEYIISYKIDS